MRGGLLKGKGKREKGKICYRREDDNGRGFQAYVQGNEEAAG